MSKEQAIEDINKLIKNKDKFLIKNLSKGHFLLKVGVIGSICRMSLPITVLATSITHIHNSAYFLLGFVGTIGTVLFEMSNASLFFERQDKYLPAGPNELVDFVKKMKFEFEKRNLDNKILLDVVNIMEQDIKERTLDLSFWTNLKKCLNKYYDAFDSEENKREIEINNNKNLNEINDIKQSLLNSRDQIEVKKSEEVDSYDVEGTYSIENVRDNYNVSNRRRLRI